MFKIAPEIWFPVVTLLLGFIAKSFSDYLNHTRALHRDREAREVSRSESARERRETFQRHTLLELQEAVADLTRCTARINHEDTMASRATGRWQRQLVGADLDERYRVAQATTHKLGVRIADDTIRSLLENLKSASSDVTGAPSPEVAGSKMREMTHFDVELNDRIGVLLRGLDR